MIGIAYVNNKFQKRGGFQTKTFGFVTEKERKSLFEQEAGLALVKPGFTEVPYIQVVAEIAGLKAVEKETGELALGGPFYKFTDATLDLSFWSLQGVKARIILRDNVYYTVRI